MQSRHRTLAAQSPTVLRFAAALLALAAGVLAANDPAEAASEQCAMVGACGDVRSDERYLRFSTALPPAKSANAARIVELSDQEFTSFSGVGAIVCSVGSETRSSTAFLVGAFDIAVTVAHTFDAEGTQPSNCVYTSIDSLGQIRERIPVAYIKTQWTAEEGASGQVAKDLAVLRLSAPSRYAQRTMPLGKFSGSAAPVVLIGYKADLGTDTLKLKKRGTVYDRSTRSLTSSKGGFIHDMDSLEIAAGAPVMDERTGVIIGIHTRLQNSANTMITMNDWLEATLRSEIEQQNQSAEVRQN